MNTFTVNVKDKVAIVTGASRGIGQAIAVSLAANGAIVYCTSRKIEDLQKVVQSIESQGGKAHAFACHIGKLDDIQNLFKVVEEQYGRLDILVNNAATNPYFGDVLHATPDAWDKTVDVNLKGYFFMSQYAANLMIKNGGGSIVNVSSINGIRPAPFQGIYSITKAGVIAMTKSFAKELAPFNVRVNAILPGLTDTKFSSVMTQNQEILNMILPTIPMKRVALPEEMVGAVLYLVSDASTYTTGATIVIDGGALA